MSILNNLASVGALVPAALILGLLIGSFLNVVIYRLPKMLERQWRAECVALTGASATPEQPEAPFNLVTPASTCPHCGHRIRPWENIPALSYLLLRGRCSQCRQRISVRYPIVEVVTGILSAALAWHFGPTPQLLAALVLTWGLIALTMIDADTQLLPDVLTLPLLWLGLLVNTQGLFTDLNSAVWGAAAGYLSLWTVYWLFKLITGKEGMGYGDFKLLAALGAWMGWQMLPLIILLSSLVGAVVGIAMIIALGRDRQIPIPFGPYLATAGWIALLWGEPIVNAWLGSGAAGGGF
ncbi:A24 family peptidase [Hahella sp. SMD15-11]|uniref:Prepilin leader peptidase/N-methyltransferase n=1 Tax=Thermohahella caldifontis TaxID=3142973 RepID=A0AB39UZA4_9GAMM